SVDPGTWPDNEVSSGEINGENFRLDESEDDEPVDVDCVDPDGNEYSLSQGAVDVDWSDYNNSNDQDTEIPYSIDMNNESVDKGSRCVVTVNNTDGSYAEFGPVAISWPASAWRLGPWEAGPDLNTARRMPAMATGQPSREQQYLYAVGGDDGDELNARESVEYSRINLLGEPTGFSDMPRHDMPNGGRALTEAVRVDDFIYLVGGFKGSASSDSGVTGEIIRANVLDPFNVPEITNISFDYVESDGLDEGTYYYRVSAVLDSNSDYNPGGETLASEPMPVTVPDAVDGDVQLSLSWDAFEDADEYRVYRSPSPDMASGEEELIATVSDDGSSSYSLDDDDKSPQSSDNPLPIGAIGEWHEPDSNASISARHSHAMTMVEDPDEEDRYHIYAIGGLDDNDEALDSIDRVTVDVDGTQDQSISSTATGVATLDEARYEHEAGMGTETSATNLDDPPMLYAFGGRTDGGFTNAIDYFEVSTGGALSNRQSATTTGLQDYAGYLGGVANDRLYLAYGRDGSASDSAQKSAEIQSDGGLGTASTWSALTMEGDDENRYMLGSTPLYSIVYVAGGLDTNDDARKSVDFSVVGSTSQ
ncbi:MAG: hypothetical protein ACOCV2_05825, partial [Persicimonas sp.]